MADLFALRCSLTGLHAGLFHASASHVFVTACDTPFLKTELVALLLENVGPKWDVIIPETGKGMQPLCAVYSRQCLKPIARQLKKNAARIVDFFPLVRVKKISESRLREAAADELWRKTRKTGGAGPESPSVP